MRTLGQIVLFMGLVAVGFAVAFAWVSAPPEVLPADLRPPHAAVAGATPDNADEGTFCAFAASQYVSSDFATLAQVAGFDQRLASLAAEWGRTGDEGARAQVLLQCRRMGLLT